MKIIAKCLGLMFMVLFCSAGVIGSISEIKNYGTGWIGVGLSSVGFVIWANWFLQSLEEVYKKYVA